MVVVVADAAEGIQSNHLEVRSRQCGREFLSNSLKNPRTRFLLNADRKCRFSPLLSLLRRYFVVRELPVRLAFLVGANVHDGSGFSAVHNDCDLGIRTLPSRSARRYRPA